MLDHDDSGDEDDIARDPYSIDWKIDRDGRAWTGDEARHRMELTPEKLEMWKGKLLWNDSDRLLLLGLLIENVGVDKVVRLGDAGVWREAIAALSPR